MVFGLRFGVDVVFESVVWMKVVMIMMFASFTCAQHMHGALGFCASTHTVTLGYPKPLSIDPSAKLQIPKSKP